MSKGGKKKKKNDGRKKPCSRIPLPTSLSLNHFVKYFLFVLEFVASGCCILPFPKSAVIYLTYWHDLMPGTQSEKEL